jgi:AraC-like DNA-binding protein
MPPQLTADANRLDGRVASAYVQPLLELVQERGVALHTLALAAGLPDHALSPMPESIAAHSFVCLLDAGAALTADDQFGLHVGERVKLGTYSVYGLILLSCRDFGQVFQQTQRFESLAHDLGVSSLVVQGDTAQYLWHSHFPQASRHLAESVFAGVRVFSNWLAGMVLPAARLSFTHPAPSDTAEHQRIFGIDVVFGAPNHCAEFPAILLTLPVPNADVGLYPVLQQHAEQLLRQKMRAQADAGIVAQAGAAIAKNLSQDRARLAFVAEDLGLTQRTLQRKLSDAGTSFQQILDRTRNDLAKDYLRQRSLGLTDIAFLLGFQNQSAFNHAFKEWTGSSPGSYRDKVMGL